LPTDRNFGTHCQFFELAERSWQKHELAEGIGILFRLPLPTIRFYRYRWAGSLFESLVDLKFLIYR
jgi:hypothetical protein